MNTTELTVIDPKEYGLDQQKASQIEQSFLPKVAERDGLVQVYENILTKEISKSVCEEASTLRKKLVKVRTGIADIHKVEKAFYLASGRYVDALKNKHTLPIEQMEERLAEVERYFENIEKERIAKLQAEREGMLTAYEVENTAALNLGIMNDEVWTAFLAGTKSTYEAKKAAEAKAEADRIAQEKADAEERERMRIENEKLKADAEAREKAMAAERAKAEAERKAIEEKAAKERAEIEAKAKAEADRLAKIQAEENAKRDAALKAEREAAEKVQRELQAKKDAEVKAEKDRIAAEEKARKDAEKLAKAPIKKQVAAWVESFTIPARPDCMAAEIIQDKFNAFKKWALEQVEEI